MSSNAVLEQQFRAQRDALSAHDAALASCEADLWALEQERTLLSSEQSLERERLEMLDRDVTVALASYTHRMEKANTNLVAKEKRTH